MFDFIKKLLKKSFKAPVKNRARTVSAPKAQPMHRPECCSKKEEKVPECASKCTCEVKPTEPVMVSTETKVVSVLAEPVEETTVEVKDESEPKNTSKYVIKLSSEEIYNFELVSPEGKTIIRSGDYTLKRSCVSGIQSVKKNGVTENIEDRTAEKPVKSPNPKYEITMDENSKYRFTLKAPNGYVILMSPAYNSKRACTSAIKNVRANSQTENVEDTTK